MNGEWRSFLEQQGAVIADAAVQEFSTPAEEALAALSGDTHADLSFLGVLRASGEDVASFLQGQLTNDLREVGEGTSQLTAYLSPKGRALAIMRALHHDGAYHFLLPEPLRDPVVQRLARYVLRARVVLEDAGQALARLGVNGPHAARRLQQAGLDAPAADGSVTLCGAARVLRIAGLAPRFVVVAPFVQARAVWQSLGGSGAPVGAPAWRLLDIDAGIAQVYEATREAFTPQMLNLELSGGVSFDKGCYPGQEIVARSHYLGSPSRRMYRVEFDAEVAPPPGAPVWSESGEAAGQVVDAARCAASRCRALVVVHKQAAAGPLALGEPGAPPARRLGLPYLLPEETA